MKKLLTLITLALCAGMSAHGQADFLLLAEEPRVAAAGGCDTVNDGSLVAYWRLDEASGNATDTKGSSTLTDNNTVTSAAGKISTSRQFTAANSEFLSIADNAALSTGNIDFWIGGWIYNDSLSGQRMIASKGRLSVEGATFRRRRRRMASVDE
jgi:hypothetical protein